MEDAQAKVPGGLFDLIMASGLMGYLVLLCVPILMVLFLVCILKRTDRLSLIFLALSATPFLIGMIGVLSGLFSIFTEVVLNPSFVLYDIAAGVYVALVPCLMGSVVSLISLFAACILLAVSRREEPKVAEVAETI